MFMLDGCCKHIWKLQLLLVTFSAHLSRMYHKIKWICRLWFEMCNKMSALVREMIWQYKVSFSTQTPETVNTLHEYSGHYWPLTPLCGVLLQQNQNSQINIKLDINIWGSSLFQDFVSGFRWHINFLFWDYFQVKPDWNFFFKLDCLHWQEAEDTRLSWPCAVLSCVLWSDLI